MRKNNRLDRHQWYGFVPKMGLLNKADSPSKEIIIRRMSTFPWNCEAFRQYDGMFTGFFFFISGKTYHCSNTHRFSKQKESVNLFHFYST